MPKIIYKYSIAKFGITPVLMPKNSEILTAKMQSEHLCIWAIIDTEQEMVERKLFCYGTGHPIPDSVTKENHIGTVMDDGMVWHVFENIT